MEIYVVYTVLFMFCGCSMAMTAPFAELVVMPALLKFTPYREDGWLSCICMCHE